jgi:hypothetical protein
MPFGSSQWMYSSGGFYPTEIDQSLMFDGTSYLSRTPSVAGNRKTWTFSTWFKRGGVSPSTSYTLFSGGTGTTANTGTNVRFQVQNDYLRLSTDNTSGGSLMSSADLRDVSAWYHVVLAFDTPQASSSDRIKMYINGEQVTSFRATPSYPTQNRDLGVNNTELQQVGGSSIGTFEKFNGYLADTYLVDGTALDPTSFGEFKNGVWIPKAYTGSYGTNGFHLEYNDNANDSSGTGNNWTATNIVAGDYMLDSPTNNFATLNPLYYLTASTHLSEGNLQLTHEAAAHRANAGTMFSKTGKWYFEVHNKTDTSSSSVALGVGLQDISKNLVYASGADNYVFYANNNRGKTVLNTTEVTWSTDGTHAPDAGDIVQVAYDADSGKIFFGVSNTYYAADAGADGNPATGANPSATLSTAIDYVPFVGTYNNEATANFGQDSSFAGAATAQGNTDSNGRGDFYYTPPAGFLALCTANLPEPSISPLYGASPQDYFNTVLWTGDGNDDRSITGVGFQPDFTWIKRREAAASYLLHNSVIGANSYLNSDTTDLEATNADGLQLFESDGFQVGANSSWNGLTRTYVAWNWKASNAASVLNEAGSIPSQVSANTTAGFSIVSYTGNTPVANATVGHGLNSAPDMVIVKNRDRASGWLIYHSANTSAPETDFLQFTTAGTTDNNTVWNDTAPTTSVFSIGTTSSVNFSGENFIAYCFHSVEGYSKFSSYTGNGNPDGPFIYTGFRPALVLIKRYDAPENWWLLDNKRNPYNQVDTALRPNDPAGDAVSPTKYAQDFLSNGIKLKTLDPDVNIINGTYIYMAFAENPFKYANAR